MYARARTVESARYTYCDAETGAEIAVVVEPGRWVFVRDAADLGIERPGRYGGGIEAVVTDLDTGHRLRAHVTDVDRY